MELLSSNTQDVSNISKLKQFEQSLSQKSILKNSSIKQPQSPVLITKTFKNERFVANSPTARFNYSDGPSHDLNFPMSSSQLLEKQPSLPDWVKREILSYPTVYFLSKLQKPLLNPSEINGEGEMKVSVGDDIEYRYEVLGLLGKGSFGQVFRVFDHFEKKHSALKIIKNNPRYLEQAQIEIDILNYLQSKNADTQANVITLIRSFKFRRHLIMAFELLSENLYENLKRNHFRGLKTQVIKKISYQALKALAFLDSQKIIHCDIKPENLVIGSDKTNSIKIIDFGSACFEDQQIFTYIQSRFYRAPEVVLGMRYTTAIDIWSLGCLIAELYTGFPIFPAENEKDLISCITEVLGEPKIEFIGSGNRSHLYFYQNGKLKPVQVARSRRGYPGCRSLKSILKGADEGLVQLVSDCLQWDPVDRIKPKTALKLSWLSDKVKKQKVYGRYCKLSMEDIVKHTPYLQKFVRQKNKASAIS